MSWGWVEEGSPYVIVQRIIGNGHMGTPPGQQNDRQTRLKTLSSHNFKCEFYFCTGDTNFQQRFGDNNNPDDHGGQQPLQQQQNGLHEEQNMQHQEEQNNQINQMQVNPPDLNPQVRTC